MHSNSLVPSLKRWPHAPYIFLGRTLAREQELTVDEVSQRFVASLRRTDAADIHPDVLEITGLVPSDVDAEET